MNTHLQRIEADRITSIEYTEYCRNASDAPATMVFIYTYTNYMGDHHMRICSGCPGTMTEAWNDFVRETRISLDDIVRIGPSDCAKGAVEVTVRNEYFPHQSGYRYWTTCSYCVTHPNYRDGGHN